VDNKIVIIPNGGLATSSTINYITQKVHLGDWKFAIAYGTDYKKLYKVVTEILNNDSTIVKNTEIFTGLAEINRIFCKYVVRIWTK